MAAGTRRLHQTPAARAVRRLRRTVTFHAHERARGGLFSFLGPPRVNAFALARSLSLGLAKPLLRYTLMRRESRAPDRAVHGASGLHAKQHRFPPVTQPIRRDLPGLTPRDPVALSQCCSYFRR